MSLWTRINGKRGYLYNALASTYLLCSMSLDIEAIVAGLSPQEKLDLLVALQKGASFSEPVLTRQELIRAELWFCQRMEKTGISRHKHAAGRQWLIFMLLRYGGLRVREIMALRPQDCQFANGRVVLPDREVYFSHETAGRLVRFWSVWPGRHLGSPLQCDASQVRRAMSACSLACAIAPNRLNARNLRRLRGQELAAGGLHAGIVAWFLGKAADPSPFSHQMAKSLLENFLATGGTVKTSARNVFQGQILSLNEHGLLVEVTIETEAGLKLTTIITKTSCKGMGLAPGKVVTALVKAPWVTVASMANRAELPDVNCYEGKVDSVQTDKMACEILVTLKQGNLICSLYANGARPAADIKEGSEVMVSFSPFAVILTEN